jgi:hypothetical protein
MPNKSGGTAYSGNFERGPIANKRGHDKDAVLEINHLNSRCAFNSMSMLAKSRAGAGRKSAGGQGGQRISRRSKYCSTCIAANK